MSRMTLSDLGAGAAAAGLGTAHAGRFRREIRMSLATGAMAETATVAAGAVLGVTFLSREANGLDPAAPEAVGLQSGSEGLVLSLPVARLIHRVRLATPVAADAIAAFRFDGQAVSDEPVAVAAHGGSGAQLDVTDSALILKRRNAGDFPLAPGAIAAVILSYPPTNPRLALRLAGSAEETPFPTQTDADGLPVFPATGAYGAGLATALSGLLARLPAPLPDPLEIDLILSADQPCSARIDALDLGLVLESHGLTEKAVLRFPGGRRVEESLTLALPPGAVIEGGSLTLSVTGAKPAAIRAETAPPPPAPDREGVELGAGRLAATRLTLSAALLVTGADCVLAAPEGEALVRVSLRADAAGMPGAILAESAAIPLVSVRPTCLPFGLPPTAQPAGPVWLGLEAVRGRALALLGETGLAASGDGRIFAPLAAAETRGLAAVLHAAQPGPDEQPPGHFELRLAGVALPGTPARGAAVIDLTPAVSALSGATAILTFASSVRAVVSLDPPLLRYTLPD